MIELAFYSTAVFTGIGWGLYIHAKRQLGSLPRSYEKAMETITFLRQELAESEKLANDRLQRNNRLFAQVNRLAATLKAVDPQWITAHNPSFTIESKPNPKTNEQ